MLILTMYFKFIVNMHTNIEVFWELKKSLISHLQCFIEVGGAKEKLMLFW